MRLLSKNKNKILSRKKSNVDQLRETGLFMPEWYVAQYPEVVRNDFDPYEHYANIGEAAGYNPNPYFNVGWYKKRSKAACQFDGLVIVHYAKYGWKNGVNPSNIFSGQLYLQEYSDVKAASINPLFHFLRKGKAENRLHFPVAFEFEKGADHIHAMKVISTSGLFFENWYAHHHTDIMICDMEPLVHYILYGAGENRNPNPFFNAAWYRGEHYLTMQNQNPLVYYIEQGIKQNHIPIPNFSAELYFAQNPDLNPDEVTPYTHFITEGFHEKRKFPDADLIKNGDLNSAIDDVRIPLSRGLRDMIDLPRNPLASKSKNFNPGNLDIHWIVPDFAAGGGGHMTIFRMAHYLELNGHDITIWINDPSLHDTPDDAYETIVKHFQNLKGNVRFIDYNDTQDGFINASGDVMIATDCWTVWPAMVPTDFKQRFYFVQDFEPAFHPTGAKYLAAEQSYKEDFSCICASPWLSDMMREKYGRTASHFWLAADTTIYTPPKQKKQRQRPRIAVYARYFTARRAVDLAFLALEKLAERGHEFEVDFFGAPLSFKQAPFTFVDHGVASPEQLATIFQNCDIGIVFSATNYSLVPQEMMACQLPILELSGENTHAIFPDDVATFAAPDPRAIADKLELLLSDEDLRRKQAEKAYEWVQSFSWEQSAKMVEAAIIEGVGATNMNALHVTISQPVKASVVIPTYNAGAVLKPVLDMVTKQHTPWKYEILVIDSGSTDGTVDLVKSYKDVKFHSIDSKDFNHGATRNLGVELTSGDYIAFLTHDACPANSHWLFNLVTSLEHFPDAAGVFGKHYAYEEASAYTKRDLNNHFNTMQKHPLFVSRDINKEAFENNMAWRQALHFYSDNNSCMRRDIWNKIPYRPVNFGEDQLWAWDIINAGYGKVYAPQAIVFHSHDYTPQENYDRNKTESAFFKHFFNYDLISNEKQFEETLKALNTHDIEWGEKHELAQETIDAQVALNEARLKGYLDGNNTDTSEMFD